MSEKLGKLICGNPEKEVDLDLLIRDVNRTIMANKPLDPQGTRCDLRLLVMAVERLAARTPSPSGAREVSERAWGLLAEQEPDLSSVIHVSTSKAIRAIESALRSQGRGEGE